MGDYRPFSAHPKSRWEISAMPKDRIVEEVRRARERYAARRARLIATPFGFAEVFR